MMMAASMIGSLGEEIRNLQVLQSLQSQNSLLEKLKAIYNSIKVASDAKFADAGGCELIVDILRKCHGSNSTINNDEDEIIGQVCLILAELTTVEGNRNKLESLDICELILDILKINQTNVSLTSKISLVLGHLAKSTQMRMKFNQTGTYRILMDILTEHWKQCDGNHSTNTNVELISNLLYGLCMILSEGPSPDQQLDSADDCQLIVSILRNHTDNPKIAEHSIWVISILAADPNNRRRLTKDPYTTCELILEVLRMYTNNNAGIVDIACLALNNLSYHNDYSVKILMNNGCCELLVDLLKLYEMNPEVICSSCCLINSLIENNNIEAKQLFINANTLELLMERLKQYKSNSMIVKDICGLFVDFMRNHHEYGKQLGELGLCEILVNALRDHREFVSVVIPVMKSICNIASENEENKLRLSNTGCHSLIFEVLRQYMSNGDVVAVTAYICMNLNFDEEVLSLLASQGVCELIVDVLKEHFNNADAAMLCVRLYHFVLNVEFKQRIIVAGGTDVILKVMKSHINNVNVLECSTAAISHLIAEEVITIQLANNEFAELLTHALKIHRNNLMLLRLLCFATGRFSRLEIGWTKLTNIGAFDILMELLNQYQSDREIVNRVCWGLSNMLQIAENKLKICVMPNAFALIVKLLKEFNSHTDTLPNVIFVINNMSSNCPQNRIQLIKVGCHESLLNVVRTHINSTTILELACSGLEKLLYKNTEVQSSLGNHEACKVIIEALKLHRDSVEIVSCYHVVTILAVHGDNRMKIIDAGGCEVLLTALGAHRHHVAIVKHICSAFANIVIPVSIGLLFSSLSDVSLIHQQFGEIGGGCELLVEILVQYKDQIDIVRIIACLIANMTINNVNGQARFKDCGCVEILSEMMETYKGDPDIRQYSSNALKNMGALPSDALDSCIIY